MTKKEKYLLFKLMEMDIRKYLISNTKDLCNGSMKAHQHKILCATYLSYHYLRDITEDTLYLVDDEYELVHTKTQQLTGYLDEVIKFPLDKLTKDIDLDKYIKLFFNRFIKISNKYLTNYDQNIDNTTENNIKSLANKLRELM